MKQLFYLFIILVFGYSYGQDLKLVPIKNNSITIDADTFVGFDGFGNCFYTKNNILFKKVDTQLLQYQNLALGKITKIDILNPLKIVIFYEDFNSVVLLDNQLNEVQKIDFSKQETPITAKAVGISGQNKLWVYNAVSQKIGLYDLNTNQYQNIGIPIQDEICYYQSDFNYFHWINKLNQWNTCTIFGRTFSNGTIEVTSNLQLLEANKILFSSNNKLYLRDRNLNKRYEIEIVEKSFKNFYYKDQILSIFTDKGITNYKITIP